MLAEIHVKALNECLTSVLEPMDDDEKLYLSDLTKLEHFLASLFIPEQRIKVFIELHQYFSDDHRREFKIRNFMKSGGLRLLTRQLRICDVNNQALITILLELVDDFFVYDVRPFNAQDIDFGRFQIFFFWMQVPSAEIKAVELGLQRVVDATKLPEVQRMAGEITQDISAIRLSSEIADSVLKNQNVFDRHLVTVVREKMKSNDPDLGEHVIRFCIMHSWIKSSLTDEDNNYSYETLEQLAASSVFVEGEPSIPSIYGLHSFILRTMAANFSEVYVVSDKLIRVLVADLNDYTARNKVVHTCCLQATKSKTIGWIMEDKTKVESKIQWPFVKRSRAFNRTVDTILDLIGQFLGQSETRTYHQDTHLYAALIDYLLMTPNPSFRAAKYMFQINHANRYGKGISEDFSNEKELILQPQDLNQPMVISEGLVNPTSKRCCPLFRSLNHIGRMVLTQISHTFHHQALYVRILHHLYIANHSDPEEMYFNFSFFFGRIAPPFMRLFMIDLGFLDRIFDHFFRPEGRRREAMVAVRSIVRMLGLDRFYQLDLISMTSLEYHPSFLEFLFSEGSKKVTPVEEDNKRMSVLLPFIDVGLRFDMIFTFFEHILQSEYKVRYLDALKAILVEELEKIKLENAGRTVKEDSQLKYEDLSTGKLSKQGNLLFNRSQSSGLLRPSDLRRRSLESTGRKLERSSSFNFTTGSSSLTTGPSNLPPRVNNKGTVPNKPRSSSFTSKAQVSLPSKIPKPSQTAQQVLSSISKTKPVSKLHTEETQVLKGRGSQTTSAVRSFFIKRNV